ncbi:MAG: hypothetical protein IJ748_02405 [Bacteroidales bacterium]|nr:hypothetical protein [Bacteroidales bacterium]
MKTLNKIILTLFFLAVSFSLTAQRTGELMYFSTLPQAQRYNPAKHGNNKFYIQIPVLGHFGVSANTSGFAYHDLVNQHPIYADSLQLDFEGFTEKLKENNYLGIGMSMDILGFGFSVAKVNHFSFNMSLNTETRFNFSDGLFRLVAYGTEAEQESLNIFKDKLLDATSYLTTSVGYSRDINDKLTVGANIKMYLGLANINSQRTDVSLDYDGQTMATISDIDINTSNAFVNWSMKSAVADDSDGVEFDDFEAKDLPSNIMKNKGFGFDLGATYKINETMTVSASIVDIGKINWKSNTVNIHSLHPNTRVEFGGIASNYNTIGDDIDNYFDELADSLKYAFDLEASDKGSYSTALPTKLYAGYEWNFFPGMYAQALYKGRIIGGKLENSLTLVYTARLGSWIQASVGNTFASKFFNPSAMLSLKDIFYVGTTFASSLDAAETTGLTAYFGLNIALKSKKAKKKETAYVSDEASSLTFVETKM